MSRRDVTWLPQTKLTLLLAMVSVSLGACAHRDEPVDDSHSPAPSVADHHTGLLWEKKTNPSGLETVEWNGGRNCSARNQPEECAADVHDVQNRYAWTLRAARGRGPDGAAFTDFLARLNGALDGADCFANRCDWRLPNIRTPDHRGRQAEAARAVDDMRAGTLHRVGLRQCRGCSRGWRGHSGVALLVFDPLDRKFLPLCQPRVRSELREVG